jgi:hypothetical protein
MMSSTPDGPTPSEEYLRRAAEAAESTRRNVRVLVWVLVGVPLILGGISLVIFLVGGVSSEVAAQSEADAYAKVNQVYSEVGYAPPAYTTVRNQVSGICENLGKGMSQADAAAAMAQGFGDLTSSQAAKIVAAAQENVCSR